MLTEAISKLLEKEKRVYPCHVNRISGLDDPCERRLFYCRTAWDKTAPIDDGFAGILRTGTELEPLIERIVSAAGEAGKPRFRIIGANMPTTDELLKKYQIQGHIDGILEYELDGQWYKQGVIDKKTAHPSIFAGLSDYDSLVKYPWTKKYRGQLMLYALGNNLERCFLLFVNKSNLYQMKLIEFPLDMEYAEGLLQKADRINKAIESKIPPLKLNDPDECPKCQFAHICMPEYSAGGELQISDDKELEAVLLRLQELSPAEKEISDLEKARDVLLTKGTDTICGQFMVTWKKIEGHRKPSAGGSYEQWRKKIIFTG